MRQTENTVSDLINLIAPRRNQIVEGERKDVDANEMVAVMSEAHTLLTQVAGSFQALEKFFDLPENFTLALERIGQKISEDMTESPMEIRRSARISQSLDKLREHLEMDYAGIWLIREDAEDTFLSESGELHYKSDMNVIRNQIDLAIERTKDGRFAFLEPSKSEDGGVDAVFVFRDLNGNPTGYVLLDDHSSEHDIDASTISEVATVFYTFLHTAISEEQAELAKRELISARTELEEAFGKLSQVSVALESSRYDLLTGLLVRRYGSEQIISRINQIRYPRGSDKVGTLCLFDVDKFKRVNDTYGHPTGDAVLKGIGEVLTCGMKTSKISHHSRKTDIFCRWGGEEFAMYLEETDRAGAIIATERISKSLQELRFDNPNG